ncbi:MAG: FHA domain-containing protein [Desulfobacteraceae bacterium]|jgi:pSer/pThr/pTyr-binding forkhead associated (FHA) protein
MNKFWIMSKRNEPRFFELNDEITFIGRSALNDVQIRDRYVSSEHLLLRKLGDRVLARDLGSTNGTFLNSNPIPPGAEVEVKEGASIVIGLSVICLGEKGSNEALALVSSINPCNEHDATDRLVSKKSGLRPVKHKPNKLGPNLTVGSKHSSNIQKGVD